MARLYDSIIIGAGIAGATMAYSLSKKGQKVLVIDKKGIAMGGSGAAGAFVSPKIGKGSALQKLTNEAFTFAKDFYVQNCSEFFHQTGVIRIPKDEDDAKKFTMYEQYNDTVHKNYTKETLHDLGIKSEFNAFYFPEAGDCDAIGICKYLLEGIDLVLANVTEIKEVNSDWEVASYKGKNLILATGFETHLLDMRYMGIRGTWGTRADFLSTLDLEVSMHQSMSVGANFNGVMKLGATHDKKVHIPTVCDEKEALKLKDKSDFLIDSKHLTLKEVFCGMRSGSKDYFPLVGQVIDVSYMLRTFPGLVRGKNPPLKYIDRLYCINGLGGRGFVFAPLMAKILTEHLIENEKIDMRVNADRLFLKWCRKLEQ